MGSFTRLDAANKAKVVRSVTNIKGIWKLDKSGDALDADLRVNGDARNWGVKFVEAFEQFAEDLKSKGITRDQAQCILRRHRDKRANTAQEMSSEVTKRNKKITKNDIDAARKEVNSEFDKSTLRTFLELVANNQPSKITRRRRRTFKKVSQRRSSSELHSEPSDASQTPQDDTVAEDYNDDEVADSDPVAPAAEGDIDDEVSDSEPAAPIAEDHTNDNVANSEPAAPDIPAVVARSQNGSDAPTNGRSAMQLRNRTVPQSSRATSRATSKRRGQPASESEDVDVDAPYAMSKPLQRHIDLTGPASPATGSAKRRRVDDTASNIETGGLEEQQREPTLLEPVEEQPDETELLAQHAVDEPAPEHTSVVARRLSHVSLERSAGSPPPAAPDQSVQQWTENVGDGRETFRRRILSELKTAAAQRGTIEAEMAAADDAWQWALLRGSVQEQNETGQKYNELVIEKSRLKATIAGLQGQLEEVQDE